MRLYSPLILICKFTRETLLSSHNHVNQNYISGKCNLINEFIVFLGQRELYKNDVNIIHT